jgi:hypothetical protein
MPVTRRDRPLPAKKWTPLDRVAWVRVPASAKDDLFYAMSYESGSSPHGVGVLQYNEGSNVEDACWMAYQIKIISQDMIGERSPSESDFRRRLEASVFTKAGAK